jgi:hypothetical protein
MAGISEALDRLVNPWVLVISADEEVGEDRVQEFPPLLDILADAVTPSNNARGGGGDVATRNPVDVKALNLLMHIQDVVGAWAVEYRVTVSARLTTRALAVAGHVAALYRSGQMVEEEYLRRLDYFDRWAGQIWDLVEPPLQRPIRAAACPRCGTAKVTDTAGDVVDALALEHRYGQEIVAVCRAEDCTAVWVGQPGLMHLGRELGIEFNTAILVDEVE